MFSVQVVTAAPRSPGAIPPEVARIDEAIAKYPDSRWRRLVAEFYRDRERGLVGYDITEMSLACAEGLPRCQDRDQILETLDKCTHEAREQTEKWWSEFEGDPGKFDNSANRYRMVVLCTVLSCGFKVACNHAYTSDSDSRDSRYLFLDGALTGFGGSCGSLAVLCVAVGRRLGYPLWLVRTHDHAFARWEGPNGERFNVECTTPGLVSHSDEHYRTWTDLTVSNDQIAHCGVLQNLRPFEELAFLLAQRGMCLRDNLLLDEAEEALFHANQLVPWSQHYWAQWYGVRVFRRMIQLAQDRGNREGPLSVAVEQVPYPEPADPFEARVVPRTRDFIARLRQCRSSESGSPASPPRAIVQT